MRALKFFVVLSLATWLGACSTIEPFGASNSTSEGQALFDASADAHGRAAFEQLNDVNVSFDSIWYSIVTFVQPDLVDALYRNGSQERILLRDGLHAQVHRGESGEKWVLRQWLTPSAKAPPRIEVKRNGQPDDEAVARASAAVVTDAYRLFLLGPLNFLNTDAQFRTLPAVQLAGRLTDRLLIQTRPGLGMSDQDRVVLYIDREDRLTRRIWFTLEGLETTRNAVIETNVSDYQKIGGVQWPTKFYERIRRPMPYLPAHRWSLTGLDLNRGLSSQDFVDGQFSERAQQPAAPIQ